MEESVLVPTALHVSDEIANREGLVLFEEFDVHVAEGEGKRSPLADLPNVVLTPHIGAQTIDAQEEIGREVVAIINRYDTALMEGKHAFDANPVGRE